MIEIKLCAECGKELDPRLGICTFCLFASTIADTVALALDMDPSEPIPARIRYIGGYEVLEQIARGGMGVIFRARQTTLNREVALKLLTGGAYASEEMIRRFKAEAEMAATLRHPHIVAIYDIGEHEGEPYFAMEYIDGSPLPSFAEGDVSLRQGIEIMVKVASVVQFAHQHGVIHRDLKPSNILVDREGQPHLTDFGIAKLIAFDSTLTHTNALLGTPSYVAPEVARGETKFASTAVDVYGLGAVLYYLVTGTPPFAGGTSMATVRQVIEEAPRKPSILNPELDRDIETVILKCLEKEPGSRYASAGEVAEELSRWLDGKPICARRAGLVERSRKWIRRHPIYSLLLVMLATSFGGGTAGILWQWRRAETGWQQAEAQKDIARQQQIVAQAERRTARYHAYAADINLAQKLMAEGDADGAVASLLRHVPKNRESDLRGIEWRFLWHQLIGRPKTVWKTDSAGDRVLQEAGAGKVLMLEQNGTILRLRDLESGAALQSRHIDREDVSAIRLFSGELLALGTKSGQVQLTEFKTGRARWVVEKGGAIQQCVFSKDGRSLAVVFSADGTRVRTELLDGATGKLVRQLFDGVATFIAATPDNSFCVAGMEAQPFEVDQVPTLRFIFRMEWGTNIIASGASIGGVAQQMYRITCMDTRTNAGGDKLVVHGNHLGLIHLTSEPLVSTNNRPVHPQAGAPIALAFTADSEVLSIGKDQWLKLWDFGEARERRRAFLPSEATGLAVREEDVAVSVEGYVHVYSLQTLRMPQKRLLRASEFSSDERFVASRLKEADSFWMVVSEFESGREVARSPVYPARSWFSSDSTVLNMVTRRLYYEDASSPGSWVKTNEFAVIRWEFHTGAQRERALIDPPHMHDWRVSTSGDWVLGKDTVGNLVLWSGATGQRIASVTTPEPQSLLAFTPDEKFVLTSDTKDTVHFRAISTLDIAFSIKTIARAFAADFSADHQFLALASPEITEVFPFPASSETKAKWRLQTPSALNMFSADSERLSSGSKLFDLKAGRELLSFRDASTAFLANTALRYLGEKTETEILPTVVEIDSTIRTMR